MVKTEPGAEREPLGAGQSSQRTQNVPSPGLSPSVCRYLPRPPLSRTSSVSLPTPVSPITPSAAVTERRVKEGGLEIDPELSTAHPEALQTQGRGGAQTHKHTQTPTEARTPPPPRKSRPPSPMKPHTYLSAHAHEKYTPRHMQTPTQKHISMFATIQTCSNHRSPHMQAGTGQPAGADTQTKPQQTAQLTHTGRINRHVLSRALTLTRGASASTGEGWGEGESRFWTGSMSH